MAKRTLPPKVEEKVQAYEAQAKRATERIRDLEQSVDEAIQAVESLDDTLWDDPSVVQRIEDLSRTAERVRRGSTPPPLPRTVRGGT